MQCQHGQGMIVRAVRENLGPQLSVFAGTLSRGCLPQVPSHLVVLQTDDQLPSLLGGRCSTSRHHTITHLLCQSRLLITAEMRHLLLDCHPHRVLDAKLAGVGRAHGFGEAGPVRQHGKSAIDRFSMNSAAIRHPVARTVVGTGDCLPHHLVGDHGLQYPATCEQGKAVAQDGQTPVYVLAEYHHEHVTGWVRRLYCAGAGKETSTCRQGQEIHASHQSFGGAAGRTDDEGHQAFLGLEPQQMRKKVDRVVDGSDT